jgi:hypothetical protein
MGNLFTIASQWLNDDGEIDGNSTTDQPPTTTPQPHLDKCNGAWASRWAGTDTTVNKTLIEATSSVL